MAFTQVRAYLEDHDEYRLDSSLQAAQAHGCDEGAAYLLERTGDVRGAMRLTLQTLAASLDALSRHHSLDDWRASLPFTPALDEPRAQVAAAADPRTQAGEDGAADAVALVSLSACQPVTYLFRSHAHSHLYPRSRSPSPRSSAPSSCVRGQAQAAAPITTIPSLNPNPGPDPNPNPDPDPDPGPDL